mgnify:CR=1 FL=1
MGYQCKINAHLSYHKAMRKGVLFTLKHFRNTSTYPIWIILTLKQFILDEKCKLCYSCKNNKNIDLYWKNINFVGFNQGMQNAIFKCVCKF